MSLGWQGLWLLRLVCSVSWRGSVRAIALAVLVSLERPRSPSFAHAAASNQQSPLPVQSCRGSPQALESPQVDTRQASDPSRSCCQRVQGAGLASQALQLPGLLPTARQRQPEVRVWIVSCVLCCSTQDCCVVVTAPAGGLQRHLKACVSTWAIKAAAGPWEFFCGVHSFHQVPLWLAQPCLAPVWPEQIGAAITLCMALQSF